MRTVGRLDQLLEDVVEPFLLEIPLLLGDPFLQPEVRFDNEFVLGHAPVSFLFSSTLCCSLRTCYRLRQQQIFPAGGLSRCSAMRRAPIILTCSSMSRRAPAASRISINEASSPWTSMIWRATSG